MRYPDRFAALVAIASPQREPWAEWVTACPRGPVYVVHGIRDRRVPVSDSQVLHDHLRALGCDVDLTVLPNAGHTFDTLDQILLELATLFERQRGLMKGDGP